MSAKTSYWLNIRGVWLPVPDVNAYVEKTLVRPRSLFTTLGNVNYEQMAAKAVATWDVRYPGSKNAETSRLLQYASTGQAGPVWLYDLQAAQANMLPENNTQGSAADAVNIDVDGIPMPAFDTGDTVTRMLLGGVAYHLSYTTTGVAGEVIGTYDIGAGPVDVIAPPGVGPRRGSHAFLPADAVEVEIEWTAAGVTSGAMLRHDSVSVTDFLPGENTPCRVSVQDRAQTIGFVYQDKLARAEATFQIREVG